MAFGTEPVPGGGWKLNGTSKAIVSAVLAALVTGGISTWRTSYVMQVELRHVVEQIGELKAAVATARNDPFTGSDGRELERGLRAALLRESERIRRLELLLARQGVELPR